jgi:uncharacterized protein
MGDGEFAEGPEVESELEASLERVPLAAILRGLAFAAIAVGLVGGLHYYIALRFIEGARLSGQAEEAAWTAAGALFCSIPLSFFLRGVLPRRAASAMRTLVYLWMGLFALLITAVAVADLGSALFALARGTPASARWNPGLLTLVLAVAVTALAFGVRTALGPPDIERIAVPIAGLRPGLEGLRIVQISDLHIGETLHADWAESIAREVNRLEPDVVAITGDLADGSAARLGEEVAPLGGIRARLGTFFVTGNHEYYNGAPGWEERVRSLGITVLHNEHRVLSRGGDALVVAGVTDSEGGRFSAADAPRPDLAFAGAPEGAPRVLLAHQPRAAFQAAPFGVDLQLSGHTHGGQIFPWMFFVRLQQPVLRGLKRVAGVRVYTHRGTGFWGPPVRVGARAEIACLTLTRA